MKLLSNFAQRALRFCREKSKEIGHIFIFAPLLGLQGNLAIENNNILSYDTTTSTHDFNRLRLDGTLQHTTHEALTAKVIIDNQTSYHHNRDNLTNTTTIYRAYLEYIGEKHFVAIGRQQASFGVGRIWNPIDLFNPIDSLSIETGEREGTESLRYQYAINDLSDFDITVSKEKSVARIKGFLRYADLALLGGLDDENDRNMVGYEAAGELFRTNIELRSEGGLFYDKKSDAWQNDFIVGADYGFQNSLTLLGEYRYNGANKTDYFGTTVSYQATPLMILSLLNITQLKDRSFFIAPSIEYSLADEMTLRCGAFLFTGSNTDEFGVLPDNYYLNVYIHF